jgi:hypothetical protein
MAYSNVHMTKKTDSSEALTRSKLRKKVLERWENEGGKIGNEPPNGSTKSESTKQNNKGTEKTDRPD